MIGVLIIPTGIGAEIGGHAGDGNPVAKLLASVCDTLITHPNVVNASDINEMTYNTLYVEGSMLDRFLQGEIELKRVASNRVLVAINPPLRPETVNAVSAARLTVGMNAEIVELKVPLRMVATKENKKASGIVEGWQELCVQVSKYEFDALAITSPIEVDHSVAIDYMENGGVNPWGGVEAKASKLIARALDKPVAHAPTENGIFQGFNKVVDPRMAAEMVSVCYLHCILKGLHKAPRIGRGVSVDDVDCLITPVDCLGAPHQACLDRRIPIIAVRENQNCLNDEMPSSFIQVDNYIEAAGLLTAMKAGVSMESVRRPIYPTTQNSKVEVDGCRYCDNEAMLSSSEILGRQN